MATYPRTAKLVCIAALLAVTGFEALAQAQQPSQMEREAPAVPLIVRRISTRAAASIEGERPQDLVTVNADLLRDVRALISSTTIDGVPTSKLRIEFNAFDSGELGAGANEVGLVEHVSNPAPDTTVARGPLVDEPEGEFSMTIHQGLVVARVHTNDRSYVIRPASKEEGDESAYVVEEELDENEDGEDTPVPALAPGASPSAPKAEAGLQAMAAEDGSRIDVLIAYTPKTRDYWGSVAKIQLAARDAETNMNTALARSLPSLSPPVRIRVVAIEEVPNGVTSVIGSMKNSASLTNLRKLHKADLVLVFHHANLSYAGKAFIYCGDPDYGRKNAFGVVKYTSLWRYMTPVHELGHLLGAAHNPANTRGTCWQSDMRGHHFDARNSQGVTKHYGTMMSYPGIRIRYFSNPNVSYLGVPTGLATRNNAKAIRESRKIVANYFVNDDAPVETGEGPIINIIRPQDAASLPAQSKVLIEARIADADNVATAELFWERTSNFLKCPGSASDWSCQRNGDLYTWSLDVGRPGQRSYYLRATDAAGNRSTSPTRTISIVDQSTSGPLIRILRPANNAALLANSTISVSARVADGDGVTKVELFWERTMKYLPCPGTNNTDWKCSKTGDEYVWSLDVSTGTRTFHIRAADSAGNVTTTEARTIRLRSR